MRLFRRIKRAWTLTLNERRQSARGLPQTSLDIPMPPVVAARSPASRQRAHFLAAAYPLACMARGAVITFTEADHHSRAVTRLAAEMRISFEKCFIEFLDAPSMENLQRLRIVWTDFLDRIEGHIR